MVDLPHFLLCVIVRQDVAVGDQKEVLVENELLERPHSVFVHLILEELPIIVSHIGQYNSVADHGSLFLLEGQYHRVLLDAVASPVHEDAGEVDEESGKTELVVYILLTSCDKFAIPVDINVA